MPPILVIHSTHIFLSMGVLLEHRGPDGHIVASALQRLQRSDCAELCIYIRSNERGDPCAYPIYD